MFETELKPKIRVMKKKTNDEHDLVLFSAAVGLKDAQNFRRVCNIALNLEAGPCLRAADNGALCNRGYLGPRHTQKCTQLGLTGLAALCRFARTFQKVKRAEVSKRLHTFPDTNPPKPPECSVVQCVGTQHCLTDKAFMLPTPRSCLNFFLTPH